MTMTKPPLHPLGDVLSTPSWAQLCCRPCQTS
jgi:hypothetical protein